MHKRARLLVSTPRFERAVARYVRRNQKRQECIARTLLLMGEDIYDTRLKTHELGGELKGLYACSCRYDCRILFSIEIDAKAKSQRVLLLDIGTHDEVY